MTSGIKFYCKKYVNTIKIKIIEWFYLEILFQSNEFIVNK